MPDDKAYIKWAVRNIQNIFRLLTALGAAGASSLDYFLTDTASDLGGYFRMQDNETGDAQSDFTEAGLGVGNHLVDTWVTPIGEPGSNTLLAGLYDSHIHAQRTAGNRTLRFYWELYTRTHPAGVETLRMTSDLSDPITIDTGIDLHAAIGTDIELDTTDRLVFKLYAAVSGVGANVSLEVHAEGDRDSHVTVPVTTGILSNIFVRRDGTIDLSGNWVISTHNITLSAGTLTARVLAAGDATNAGTIHLHDGAGKKQVLTAPAMAADVPFKFPTALRVGEYLKCGAAGAHVFDVPAGAGGIPAITFGHLWANEAQTAVEFSNNFNPDVVPAAPNALNEEFEGAGAIDVKWTKVNDPAGADALNQTDFDGFLHVGLLELGGPANQFVDMAKLYQTPPAGNQVMEYVVKCAVSVVAGSTNLGNPTGPYVYLADSANNEFVASVRLATTAFGAGFLGLAGGHKDNGAGFIAVLATEYPLRIEPTGFLYLKLEKATANAYTAANTYNTYFSTNGIIWHHSGNDTITFTANCDQVGIMFRRPSNDAGGAPKGEAIVDFFRRTA